jgi:hypothetical protein
LSKQFEIKTSNGLWEVTSHLQADTGDTARHLKEQELAKGWKIVSIEEVTT